MTTLPSPRADARAAIADALAERVTGDEGWDGTAAIVLDALDAGGFTITRGDEPDDRARVIDAVVNAIATLSPDNLARGTTYDVKIPRRYVRAVADMIDAAWPGVIADEQARRAAVRVT